MINKTVRSVAVTAAALLLAAVMAATAVANWYDDIGGGTYKEIKGKNFVADSFCGVDSLYNENDTYYQCNELIMRFYREAFGLEVLAYANTGLVMLTEGYAFEPSASPKRGDVIYCTAAMRGSASDHWAIVKDYSGGKLTLFEQNVVWEGKAGVGRQLKYPSDSYYIYTPVGLGGNADPVPRGASQPVTEKQTTAKPTMEKPTAAKPTAARSTTAVQTTAKPATTAAATTTAPVTETTTAAPATAELTSAPTAASKPAEPSVTVSQSVTHSDGGGNERAEKLATAGASLAAVIVMAALLIKRKRK